MMQSRIFKDLTLEEIKRAASALYGSDTAIVEHRLLKGGLFNTTYYVKTNKDINGIVLRAAPINQHLLFDFERSMMSAEPLFYKMLGDNGIPTSKVLFCDDSYTVMEREYIIFEYIDGVPMNDPLVPYSAKPGLYRKTGMLISRMHGISHDKFGWLRPEKGTEMFNDWSSFLKRFAGETANRAANYSVFSDKELKSFLKVFDNSSLFDIGAERASMVHTDLWEGNILVREIGGEWEVAALIDADRAIFGDKEMEFGSPWMINDDFLAGYGQIPDNSPDSALRRCAYRLLTGFFATYVWSVQYDNEEAYQREKAAALAVLSHFANFV